MTSSLDADPNECQTRATCDSPSLDSINRTDPNQGTRVNVSGQSTNPDFWRLFGPTLLKQRLTHTPLLAFRVSDVAVTVEVYDRARDALSLPDDTPLMVQWPGQWRSDWFQLTVGELRAASELAG